MVYMNYGENTSWMELGLTLGHEAHRDGVVGTEDEQFYETMDAVLGHIAMALRMGANLLYAN